ncbi:MAG: Uma2 family endonuclease [Planctomycetota bacterium]
MSVVSQPIRITLDQFLAIPADDKDRELIAGEIRERPMTRRNRFHARTESKIAHYLCTWLAGQPQLDGCVYSGEVGVILSREPDTNVGIDVAYFSGETEASQSELTTMIEGVPVLAVEILSPPDEHQAIVEKVHVYLDSGVQVVWIVDPEFQTVTVHRRDHHPQLFNIEQSIAAEPSLPGLEIRVQQIC